MNTCTTPAPTNRGDQKNRPRTPLCSQTQGSRQGLSERDLRFRLAGHSLPVEVSVGRGPGALRTEQVCDLLDGLLPGVVELLGELGLVGSELGPGLPDRPRALAEASPSVVFATISSRWGPASTDNIPNIACPSIVEMTMLPCSMTCRTRQPTGWSGPAIGIRPRARKLVDVCGRRCLAVLEGRRQGQRERVGVRGVADTRMVYQVRGCRCEGVAGRHNPPTA